MLWIEVRVLQALVFGMPSRQFLTAEPIDTYRGRGMIETDPREDIDRSMSVLLDATARAAADGQDRHALVGSRP